MNILLLNWRDPKNPRAGGAEYVTMQHAKAWRDAGHEVTWLASAFPGSKNNEVINGVNIIRRGREISLFFYAPYFYKTAKRKYDLVVDEIHGIPFFTPIYVRVPILAFIHEVAGEIWNYAYPFPLNLLGSIIEKISFSFYRHIQFWTDAKSTIDDLVAMGIRRDHCVAIPCPIDNKPLRSPSKKEANPTFLFIGRLVSMKGAEGAIDAFSFIREYFPKTKLWIVGQGEEAYVRKLKDKVTRLHLLGAVHFYGFVGQEKKLELMRRAHLLLHPSVKEGWGLVVLEAASQATPTIGYNVSGLRDAIINGKTGILVAPLSPAAMAEAGKEILKEPERYRQMQRNCLHFSASFSWEDAGKKSLELLSSVFKKSPVTTA